MLIIENDVAFSQIIRDMGREQGFRTLVTAFGAAGLTLARERRPDAITLDIRLADMEGWRVLGRLKTEIELRHIPVYVISTDGTDDARWLWAPWPYSPKPVHTREALRKCFRDQGSACTSATAAARADTNPMRRRRRFPIRCVTKTSTSHIVRPTTEAMTEMPSGPFDCVVVSTTRPDDAPYAWSRHARRTTRVA